MNIEEEIKKVEEEQQKIHETLKPYTDRLNELHHMYEELRELQYIQEKLDKLNIFKGKIHNKYTLRLVKINKII